MIKPVGVRSWRDRESCSRSGTARRLARVKTRLRVEDARRLVAVFVAHYNEIRLHRAIGYITPAAKLADRDRGIFAERDRKLNATREWRKAPREASRPAV
jgi:transposase InsO family protein